MKAITIGLALATSTLLPLATAQADADMTLSQFRAYNREQRIFMVLGAMTWVEKAVTCPTPVTVGEVEASLVTRQLPGDKSWAVTMIEVMAERGCRAMQQKGDT